MKSGGFCWDLVSSGLFWRVLVSSGALSSGEFWWVLVSSGRVLVNSGEVWRDLMSFGLFCWFL